MFLTQKCGHYVGLHVSVCEEGNSYLTFHWKRITKSSYAHLRKTRLPKNYLFLAEFLMVCGQWYLMINGWIVTFLQKSLIYYILHNYIIQITYYKTSRVHLFINIIKSIKLFLICVTSLFMSYLYEESEKSLAFHMVLMHCRPHTDTIIILIYASNPKTVWYLSKINMLIRESTQCSCWVVGTTASYLGGPRFKVSARRPVLLTCYWFLQSLQ